MEKILKEQISEKKLLIVLKTECVDSQRPELFYKRFVRDYN